MRLDILAHSTKGDRSGPPLFLVHPLGANGSFWDGCVDDLAPTGLTVSVDLRGAGKSPDLTEPLTLQHIVEDLESLRSALGLDRIVVIGCAVGAMAAAAYAHIYPNRTRALVMSNPGMRIDGNAAAALLDRAQRVRSDGMAAIMPSAVDNAFANRPGPQRDAYARRFVAQNAANYAWACVGASTANIEAIEVRCPTLIIAGHQDRLFGVDPARQLAHKIAGSTLVELEQGAHFIPYQTSAEFCGRVLVFLKSLET
ncbi:alpha/beta hydrolase [Mesorhizobium sp. B2-6-1]|uniref:alpha/beta fold hydrolase n=1 Tax=Mesorhizobium sp. B2-6-1 TaxID=2589916 RepID=UPI0015E4968E|nr:alpha/beta hydrolase [Mesorhizobium sp. B2-6-1]